jgi:hypothetical protein
MVFNATFNNILVISWRSQSINQSIKATFMGRGGRDRMVVGFSTTFAISAYN